MGLWDLSISDRLLLGNGWELWGLASAGGTIGADNLRDLLARLSHQVLGLLGVFAGIGRDGVSGTFGVLSCHVFDLLALLGDHVSSVLELSIDDFLVLDVDERTKVDGKSCDQGKTPEWNELDQEIGNEGGNESLNVLVAEVATWTEAHVPKQ